MHLDYFCAPNNFRKLVDTEEVKRPQINSIIFWGGGITGKLIYCLSSHYKLAIACHITAEYWELILFSSIGKVHAKYMRYPGAPNPQVWELVPSFLCSVACLR